jgi:hypothetical protein
MADMARAAFWGAALGSVAGTLLVVVLINVVNVLTRDDDDDGR